MRLPGELYFERESAVAAVRTEHGLGEPGIAMSPRSRLPIGTRGWIPETPGRASTRGVGSASSVDRAGFPSAFPSGRPAPIAARHAAGDVGFWNSLRGRRVRVNPLLDGWGFRAT
jgi:hypothetical protein